MADKPVFLYVATYNRVEDAKADYEAVKGLHARGLIGTYDAAIINKDASGKVHITKHEKPTQHGAWTGMAVGAVAGIFFPPALIWDAAIGAGAGALIGHLWKGMSRQDMKQFGDMLNTSTAALVVVGESKLQQTLQKAVTHAAKQYESQLSVDAKAFDREFNAAVNQLAASPATSPAAHG